MLLIKFLLVLCSAAAVMAQGQADAVMSAALFFGEDTTESHRPMDVFQNPINHATAAASILVQSAQLSDFRPNEKSAKSLASVHGDFVEKVSTFIGFKRMNMFEEAVPLKNHATVEEFEQAIHDKLLEATLNGKIASKFARLLPFHQEDESLRNWILSLVVLDKLQGGDIVRIQLARVKLSIAFDQTYTGTKAYIPQQHASVIVDEYEVNISFLTVIAEQLARRIPIVGVQKMITIFASPESDVDRPFAFGSQQRVLSC